MTWVDGARSRMLILMRRPWSHYQYCLLRHGSLLIYPLNEYDALLARLSDNDHFVHFYSCDLLHERGVAPVGRKRNKQVKQ
mmetsp:Transcript_93725/g.147435  ORF Transcript_93725/g.147435 Transcript_93725/m.147435 type:complete len:81 (-) Transcript_93725:159-401(-)